jgi:murein DD-endopeptidase MepM/ murein hydrolase activator NlpD
MMKTLTSLTMICVMSAAVNSIPAQTITHKLKLRSELTSSETVLPAIPSEGSTDPADLTPLPVEMADQGTHLPEGFELSIPFVGRFRIRQGYGYEARGWTHRTIGNEQSANDFFAVDFEMPTGTPVLAAAPGTIVQSGRRDDSYGNYIVIDHGGGLSTIYAHLDSLRFQVTAASPETHVRVERGEQIGLSGSTGTRPPHLHFGVHTGAHRSFSGCDVGGLATVPEPLGGRYGLRQGQMLGE